MCVRARSEKEREREREREREEKNANCLYSYIFAFMMKEGGGKGQIIFHMVAFCVKSLLVCFLVVVFSLSEGGGGK